MLGRFISDPDLVFKLYIKFRMNLMDLKKKTLLK